MPKHRLDHSAYFQNQACPIWGRKALPRGPGLQRSTPRLLGGDLMQGFTEVLALMQGFAAVQSIAAVLALIARLHCSPGLDARLRCSAGLGTQSVAHAGRVLYH